MNAPLLEVRGLKKRFEMSKSWFGPEKLDVYAVDGVSFSIRKGETLGLVGESGCGKSTTARMVLGLTEPSEGEVLLDGKSVVSLNDNDLREVYREVQVVFQDPMSSLNPRMTAAANVAEPLRNFKAIPKDRIPETVAELFKRVGLREDQMERYPHEFSGGQRQRICIARALAINPKLIICDEPVSALDVSVQAQVINLLVDLQKQFGVSYLFVAHDLAVVEHISDRVAVMYLGRIVEIGETRELFGNPQHPYTKALMASVPRAEPRTEEHAEEIAGEVTASSRPLAGCRFSNRCPVAIDRCKVEEPQLTRTAGEHAVACHLVA